MGLYVHLPYCPYKCSYCDFPALRLPPRGGVLEEMAGAVLEEIRRAPGEDVGRPAGSVFFGGGTPSLFPPRAIEEILAALGRRYALRRGAEVTLECNPGTVDEAALAGYRRAGVTRLSIGAQTFSAERLRAIGRLHSPDETRQAVRAARRAGFSDLSLDLLYGLPGERPADAREDAREALALEPDHLSAYALELEPRTLFGALERRGELALPSDEEVVAAGEAIFAALRAAGFERYEVSNFARPGHRSRHNLLYWHQGEYRGFGPGAHSHIAGRRFWNIAGPGPYVRSVRDRGEALAGEEILDPPARQGEWIYLRLRLTEGFSLRSFRLRFGRGLDAAYPGVRQDLLAQGLLAPVPGRVQASAGGLWLLHRIAEPFLA